MNYRVEIYSCNDAVQTPEELANLLIQAAESIRFERTLVETQGPAPLYLPIPFSESMVGSYRVCVERATTPRRGREEVADLLAVGNPIEVSSPLAPKIITVPWLFKHPATHFGLFVGFCLGVAAVALFISL